MPERLDRVQIATTRQTPGPVQISWAARDQLLARLRGTAAGDAVVEKFQGSGASSAVTLTLEEKRHVDVVLDAWLVEVDVDGLPDGIFALRNAILDDLHDAST